MHTNVTTINQLFFQGKPRQKVAIFQQTIVCLKKMLLYISKEIGKGKGKENNRETRKVGELGTKGRIGDRYIFINKTKQNVCYLHCFIVNRDGGRATQITRHHCPIIYATPPVI